tara:strand:- start:66 stop:635 length:570 start_codon:yes stop_codon:yes gene_type:complete
MNVDLFSTTIHVSNNFISSDDREVMIEKLRKKSVHYYEALHGEAVSSFNFPEDIVGDLGLYKLIQKELDEYCVVLKIPNLCILNSWFNIQSPGSRLKLHRHSGSMVSGALFLKVDEKSSPLIFEDPRDLATYNFQGYPFEKFYPEPGDLVLFPSWLKHGSEEYINQSDERIVVSFNTEIMTNGFIYEKG